MKLAVVYAATKLLVAFACLMACGCVVDIGPTPTVEAPATFENVPEGGLEAYRVVLGVYGLRSAPVVHWRIEGLTCGDGRGWCADGVDYGNGECGASFCEDGGYRTGAPFVTVAWYPGASHRKSALTHELGHFWLWSTGQDPDPDHAGPVFAPGGLVSQGELALASVSP